MRFWGVALLGLLLFLPACSGHRAAQSSSLSPSSGNLVKVWSESSPSQHLDASVKTEAGVLDFDKDGVPDSKDYCPKIAGNGLKIAAGCPDQFTFRAELPYSNSPLSVANAIRERISPILPVLKADPSAMLRIETHTSIIGTPRSTLILTRDRAEAIKNYLVSELKTSPTQINAQGFGGAQPIASNTTRHGRKLNRRVEFIVTTTPLSQSSHSQLAKAPSLPNHNAPARMQASKPDMQPAPRMHEVLPGKPLSIHDAFQPMHQASSKPTPKKSALRIAFKRGKSEPSSSAPVQRIAHLLQSNPNIKVTLEGYSDNKGRADDNKLLSYQRALSVKIALIDTYNIAPERITPVGFGELRPIASNKTNAGRAMNRRVEATFAPYVPQKKLALNTVPKAEKVTYTPLASSPYAAKKKPKYKIIVSVSKCTLWLYEVQADGSLKMVRPFRVATAKKGTPFPKGAGYVTRIDFNPWWYPTSNMKRKAAAKGKRLAPVPPGSRRNPMGAIKIHLSHQNNGGAYRIHGTNKPNQIGKRVSLGCIRMFNNDGEKLAKMISVGTEVVINLN